MLHTLRHATLVFTPASINPLWITVFHGNGIAIGIDGSGTAVVVQDVAGEAPDRAIAHLIASVTRCGASCRSMCPAPGSYTCVAPGIPATRSRACGGGLNLSAPPLTTIVFARIAPRAWYWS